MNDGNEWLDSFWFDWQRGLESPMNALDRLLSELTKEDLVAATAAVLGQTITGESMRAWLRAAIRHHIETSKP